MFKSLKLALALLLGLSGAAFAADTPGVTAAEIKVGGVFPFSGPASSIGLVGKGVLAYVQSINDRGGINGRKINYIAYDDAYSPPKAVEHVRKLVESDEVAFMFGQLGTPGNTATAKYLTTKKVPALGIVSGSNKFTDVVNFPVTTTSLVSFVTEGKIYAKFLNKTLPGKNTRSSIKMTISVRTTLLPSKSS
jgi:ABC-type branched-subunit amino acid transport system substrate-binding protein